jgi:hypothetical protein
LTKKQVKLYSCFICETISLLRNHHFNRLGSQQPQGRAIVASKQGGKEISHHHNKAKAEVAGRQQTKQGRTEHVIHNKNGKIGKKNSYGNDPNPPKDKR